MKRLSQLPRLAPDLLPRLVYCWPSLAAARLTFFEVRFSWYFNQGPKARVSVNLFLVPPPHQQQHHH